MIKYLFRLPADNTRRQQWLDALNLTEDDVNEHTRVCSRHFLHGDPSNTPALDLGKRFCFSEDGGYGPK